MRNPASRARPLLALSLLAAACGAEPDPGAASAASPYPPAELVSARIDDATIGQAGWAHGQSVSADLDGDSVPERAVIIANAEDYRGRVLWSDGQVWQVYVEEADGTRTYVYKRFLQLGSVVARLARPERTAPLRREDAAAPPTILLLENTPRGFSAYEVRYSGPGEATAVQLTHRDFDLRSLFEGTPDP